MRVIAVIVVAGILASASGAVAATPEDDAKAHAQSLLKEGNALFARGEKQAALESFLAAYDAFASPKLLFNVGQAHRDLGHKVEAMEAFRRFLAETADPPPQARAEARRAVAALERQLGALEVRCEVAGAAVTVDGRPVGETPIALPIWVMPGAHTVTALKTGFAEATVAASVEAGGRATVDLPLTQAEPATGTEPPPAQGPTAAPREPTADVFAPQAPTAAPSSAPPAAPRRTWTWVAAGATGLFTAGAVAAGLSMRSRFDDLNQSCGMGSADWAGCPPEDIDSVKIRRNLANGLWLAAGAAAAATIVLFVVEGRSIGAKVAAGDGVTMNLAARF